MIMKLDKNGIPRSIYLSHMLKQPLPLSIMAPMKRNRCVNHPMRTSLDDVKSHTPLSSVTSTPDQKRSMSIYGGIGIKGYFETQ